MFIKPNETVLFQGDSVTDMDRNADPNGIGVGYVYSTVSLFHALHPDMNVTFINRGISGNRVKDLQARWQEDALDLNPDVLSILIGINDTWRRFDANDPTSTQAYEDSYRDILTQARRKNPDLKLILMDPFMLSAPIGDPKEWREDLNPRIAVVERLAKEFDALHIKLDELFTQACKTVSPAFWASDGIHPDPNGRAFIALAWLRAVGAM